MYHPTKRPPIFACHRSPCGYERSRLTKEGANRLSALHGLVFPGAQGGRQSLPGCRIQWLRLALSYPINPQEPL
jgi:hypothetical protein